MQVLMYGWEFPPHISGGLGVACYAIVKELLQKGTELTLVLPQAAIGKSQQPQQATVISGRDCVMPVPVSILDRNLNLTGLNIATVACSTLLQPYLTVAQYESRVLCVHIKDFIHFLAQISLPISFGQFFMQAYLNVLISDLHFTGNYGDDLFTEVSRYAALAGEFAANIPHEIIYAHDWLTILAGVKAKSISHKPLIFHVHALEPDRSGASMNASIFAIEKYGMEQADKIIAVSQYTKDTILKYYGIDADKVIVVHNGIYSLQSTRVVQNDKAQHKMVLFLGRLTQQKGPNYFIKIAKKILEQRLDVHFVLAGSGDLWSDLIEHVAELRIGVNVHFTGFLDPEMVNKIYELADVYVMPSVSEPFGLSCLEALAYNVPAVISKQSGVAEVVKHVLVADFWDVDLMAAKILALLNHQSLRHTMLNNAAAELKVLTWERAADAIINIYNGVLSKSS